LRIPRKAAPVTAAEAAGINRAPEVAIDRVHAIVTGVSGVGMDHGREIGIEITTGEIEIGTGTGTGTETGIIEIKTAIEIATGHGIAIEIAGETEIATGIETEIATETETATALGNGAVNGIN